MIFPELSRDQDVAHADAVRRLDESLGEQQRITHRLDEVRETRSEPDAADELHAAQAQVATREAWLRWIERGV
jgi:hypothetical protein